MGSSGPRSSRLSVMTPAHWYIAAVFAIFFALSARLFYMQVITGAQHRLASLNNIIQSVDTPAPRGDIYDRAGRPLAKNINIFQLLYIPPVDIDKYFPGADGGQAAPPSGQTWDYLRHDGATSTSLSEIERLATYLGVTYVELMQRIESERKRVYGYQPVTLVTELTRDQVVYLGEHAEEFSGVLIEQYAFKREYPLAGNAAHLVGYTARISDKDIEAFQGLSYSPREYVGKEGIERQFEQLLHGRPGSRDIEVDRNRVFRKIVRQKKPTKGTDLYLTIDANIQSKAQQILQQGFGGRPGAMIVSSLEPGHEGEILALASSPTYDPKLLRKPEYYAGLLSSSYKPLLNRAYRNAYPPGSTFKLVTATAALQEKTATPGQGYYCPGFLMIGNRRFKCHHEYGHQGVSFLEAIALSCDVAFYHIGLRLPDPPTTLKRYAGYFGLGADVGLDLPNEVDGNVPDAEWKRAHFLRLGYTAKVDWDWYDGDTANYSIGQGFLTATPLQVLWMSNLVATGGIWYPPRLLYAKTVEGRKLPVPAPHPGRRPLSEDALRSVKQGMRMAVTQGTCKLINIAGMSVCAKTGTAQTGIRGQDDHAWVVGFYPMNDPRYAFVLFRENGGLSATAVVPEARQLLLFLKHYKPQMNPS